MDHFESIPQPTASTSAQVNSDQPEQQSLTSFLPNNVSTIPVCPIYGQSTILPNVEPSIQDVMCYFPIVQARILKESGKSKLPDDKSVADQIATELIYKFENDVSNIKPKHQIKEQILTERNRYKDIMKNYQSQKYVPKFQNRLQDFKQRILGPFSIRASLKRKNRDDEMSFKKVRQEIRINKNINKLVDKDGFILNWVDRVDDILPEEVLTEFKSMCTDSESDDDDLSDMDWNPVVVYDATGRFIRINLTEFALECDRFKVSSVAAAYLANALLTAFGLITSDDRTYVIDRMRIERARSRARSLVKLNSMSLIQSRPIVALSFDGKIDFTNIMEIINGKNVPRVLRENHYVLVQLDGSNVTYLGHLTIPSRKSLQNGQCEATDTEAVNSRKKLPIADQERESHIVTSKLMDYFSINEITLEYLRVIVCDGCSVNTGKWRGVIRRLEELLMRPLQRSICLLHANELPLRHFFCKVDNCKTTGPNSFSGTIGKMLQTVENRKIVSTFQLIKVDYFPEIDSDVVQSLSRDQKLLYRLCQIVRTGKLDGYDDPIPGQLNHARWLTLAIRILRLYLSYEVAPDKIQILAEFVMRCYAPNWFDIKRDWKGINGSIHFYNMVKRSQYLSGDLLEVVMNELLINSYYGHHENILLAMLGDERETVKQMAVDKIIEIRSFQKAKQASSSSPVRRFELPKSFNSEADEYYKLVDLNDSTQLTEPPITIGVLDQDLANFVIPEYPCHSQGTERCVKLVTEASHSAFGEEDRDLMIRTTVFSRTCNTNFASKSQYTPLQVDHLSPGSVNRPFLRSNNKI